MKTQQKDNTTFPFKLSLRKQALRELDAPVVMETHGGWGKLSANCYASFPGVVFEQLPEKAAFLARQRPNWAVYEADCVRAIREGAGNHLDVNFLDLDPYGEPWPVLDAFLESDRRLPARLVIVWSDCNTLSTEVARDCSVAMLLLYCVCVAFCA